MQSMSRQGVQAGHGQEEALLGSCGPSNIHKMLKTHGTAALLLLALLCTPGLSAFHEEGRLRLYGTFLTFRSLIMTNESLGDGNLARCERR